MENKKIKVQLIGKVVEAEVLKENALTYVVRLPDGNVIKRHKIKHIVKEVV